MIRRGGAGRHGRRGAVAVIVALCLIPLIGVMAFAIDGGLLMATKRRAQTVADAAAHAAACKLYSNIATDVTGLDVTGAAKTAALANASANGFNNDGSTNALTVNIPPKSGTFAALPFHAEVVITSNQPRYFSAILGSGTIAITARGVARGTLGGQTSYTNASIIALNPTASGALSLIGGGHVTTESTIQVDSSSASAALANNAGYAKASSIQITGNYSATTSGYFATTGGSAVKTAAPVIPDPLAALAAPTTTGLTAQSFSSTYGSKTISPGVYTGGLNLGNGMTITMLPGTYYLKGGGLTVGGGVTLKGSGVTIYVDNGGGSLNLQGGAIVNLTPPTSGTYAGLVYFQDRSNTQSLQLGNGSNQSIAGTVYAPKATAVINGGSATKLGSQFIVDSMDITNNADVYVNTVTDAKAGYVASKQASASITLVE